MIGHKTINIFTCGVTVLLLMALSLLCACQTDNNDDGQQNDVKRYINLSVTVSNGHTATRASEDGDGREAGLERENKVSGITVLLYQDNDGIKTANNPTIDFAAYYTTTLVSRESAGSQYPDKTDEAVYTTGDRPVSGAAFDPTKTYHAIVVANKDLTQQIKAGTSTLNDVRNMVIREKLYTGDAGNTATDFIMSSEADCEISPRKAEIIEKTDPKRIVYYYGGIRIERLAARIDFWAVNGTYNTEKNGYEYEVYNGTEKCGDRFVVTGIMPFNLNSFDTANGNGGEYLIKRLTDNIDGGTVTYLADETGSNYVVDPATAQKGAGNEFTYFENRLSGLNLTTSTGFSGNSFYRKAADLHTALESNGGIASFKDNEMTGDNLIIAYPFENTLGNNSPLYYYATGLAIEGDYYAAGTETPQHRIYYGYLRHNGSSSSTYHAMKGTEIDKTATSTKAMEYGIVRNNIYRVYISKINKEVTGDMTITLNIKVKKWDKFEHSPIYM